MKERPIMFSAQMVRSILAGTKTQTRRLLTPNPPDWITTFGYTAFTPIGCISGRGTYMDPAEKFYRCPYGEPGDRLWVRETWAHCQTVAHIQGHTSNEISDGKAAYRADGFDTVDDLKRHLQLVGEFTAVEVNGDKWMPSIFMPRWA